MAAVSGRYARAFAEVVVNRRIDPAQASRQLNSIAELVASSVELRNVLQNPSVDRRQKLALLDAIAARAGMIKELRNFVAVLIDQRRIGQIAEIAEQFQHELNERLGVAEIKVISVRALRPEERQLLEKQMAAITGKKVQATYSQDPDLLGGAVVRVGSTIYDGSVRGKLEKIRQQLAGS